MHSRPSPKSYWPPSQTWRTFLTLGAAFAGQRATDPCGIAAATNGPVDGTDRQEPY